ncbi:hypothetical protein DEJ45_15965 [Streptomyces venezuelae]|uniref:hypothetical protein n=1 Tax=Streptomyces venezuelae TaxID=54571 RepID=UPI00123CE83F|nr:hypothetical protein [Streptomyces venezuelae]QES13762.1 hypothetical protein DEJ45_15965 [Streptomyces venezuelae]
MICRHFISPSRAYTQYTHDIIRHPRLGSDAVRLLTWQLSLPQGAPESLSRTAVRAKIGATAFTRAKRELMAEGFVHERRVQVGGGLWITQQLVSNVPLTAGAAAKLLGGTPPPPPAPAPAPRVQPGPPTCTDPVNPQVAPGRGIPAVGGPAAPSADGHPEKEPSEDTSHLPEAALALVAGFAVLSPHLRRIPPGMKRELAELVARWLDAGHSPADVQEHVLRGLPSDGTVVHRPGGLLRYLLRDVPSPVARVPRPPSRLDGTRECLGVHTQATLFRPVGDETLCGECLAGRV